MLRLSTSLCFVMSTPIDKGFRFSVHYPLAVFIYTLTTTSKNKKSQNQVTNFPDLRTDGAYVGLLKPALRNERVPELRIAPGSLIEIGQLRRFNELLLRFLPVGLVVIDRSYRIVTANGAARNLPSQANRAAVSGLEELHMVLRNFSLARIVFSLRNRA